MLAERLESGTEITPELRPLWLASRRETLGASDAAAALGLCPFKTPLEVYMEKIGSLPPIEPTIPMRVGSHLEPMLADLYTEETGYRIERVQVYYRAPNVPLSATLDGITAGGVAVEFKTIGERHAGQLGEPGTDDLPERWIVQAQQQMALANLDRCDVAVLVGNRDFRLYTVRYDRDLSNALARKLGAFWRHIDERRPPDPTSAADLRLLTRLYPKAEGAIDLGPADCDDVDEWELLGLKIKALEEERARLRARLLGRLGESALGNLPDGRVLKRKVISIPAATIERAAHERVDFRVAWGKR